MTGEEPKRLVFLTAAERAVMDVYDQGVADERKRCLAVVEEAEVVTPCADERDNIPAMAGVSWARKTFARAIREEEPA